MVNDDLDALKGAYTEDFPYDDENRRSLAWYADRMISQLGASGARSLISLGLGHRVVATAVLERLGAALTDYTIVEGSREILDGFRTTSRLPPQVKLVHDYFETFDPRRTFDAIEMGFVLEHVEDPGLVLQRFRQFLDPGGTMFIGVPNGRSLHRLLGHAAGLLDDVYKLSAADFQLGHRRYFDLVSITKLIASAGLRIARREGIFLKPLTTSQLRSLGLSPPVWNALFRVGIDFPDICNAIYLEATI
jgi:SAM-dependent methyltransferase